MCVVCVWCVWVSVCGCVSVSHGDGKVTCLRWGSCFGEGQRKRLIGHFLLCLSFYHVLGLFLPPSSFFFFFFVFRKRIFNKGLQLEVHPPSNAGPNELIDAGLFDDAGHPQVGCLNKSHRDPHRIFTSSGHFFKKNFFLKWIIWSIYIVKNSTDSAVNVADVL